MRVSGNTVFSVTPMARPWTFAPFASFPPPLPWGRLERFHRFSLESRVATGRQIAQIPRDEPAAYKRHSSSAPGYALAYSPFSNPSTVPVLRGRRGFVFNTLPRPIVITIIGQVTGRPSSATQRSPSRGALQSYKRVSSCILYDNTHAHAHTRTRKHRCTNVSVVSQISHLSGEQKRACH